VGIAATIVESAVAEDDMIGASTPTCVDPGAMGRSAIMAVKKVEAEKELFYEYLRRNKLKRTHQKELILETFLANEGHMSVEDVYALVKKKDRRVGIVTVFRTLKSLTACGIAKEITLGDGLTRFEHSYRHPLHHHIICTACHNVIEFLSPELERIQQEIVRNYQFQPQHERIQIYGICRNCREERPVPEGPKLDTGKVFARDALRMALAMQAQVVDFYRSVAGLNDDPSGRRVFEAMLKTGEGHARELESELEGLLRREKGIENAPVFLHFDPNELREVLPCLQAHLIEDVLRLDGRRSIEVSREVSDRAYGYFRELAERFSETEGKRIFQRYAEHGPECGAALESCLETLGSLPRDP
jgi:Fur family ferric uptake transcriptional regulator